MRYSVLEYLEETVKKYPDKIAFIDSKKTITFKQTKSISLNIAKSITMRISCRRKPILVYLPKGVECICTFIGILFSGNFYTPTDIKFPFQKVKSVVDVLKPELIITDSMNKKTLLNNGIEESKIIDIDEIDYSNENLDSESYLKDIISTDPVYTFFTSGSTGVPKGVVINNQSIVDYIDWASEKFKIDTDTIMGNQSPFYFDISTQDIYTTLKCGATLAIIPEEAFIFPTKALDFINEHRVNFLYWVPSAFVNVSKLDLLSEITLPNVKTMIFGGEVMPVKHLNYWLKHVPTLKCIANVCGPTETTVNYSCYIVDREFKDDEVLPLGSPLPNRELLLIDEDGNIVAEKNKLGELLVRGISLSPGYYNDFEKTNELYVQNPLNKNYPELVYKTGDLAYFNDRNELVYAGRKDFQIKHMGYRIELPEIEHIALSLQFIDNVAVIYDREKKKIIMVYESAEEISATKIRQEIGNVLPKYMLPTEYHKVERMPKNANGKIDRTKLNEMYCR